MAPAPPPPGAPEGYLYCSTTHLTDFGGIAIPTSTDELLGDLSSITFNTISFDEMFNILSSFSIAENITIFTYAHHRIPTHRDRTRSALCTWPRTRVKLPVRFW